MQLDLYEKDEIKLLLEEIRKIRETSENVRKGVFKRVTDVEKMILELRKSGLVKSEN